MERFRGESACDPLPHAEPASATPSSRAREYGLHLALARRASSGDAAAQREIFHLVKRGIQATLFRILGSNLHVEDLVQETFFELYASLPSYRGEALLVTWADRIAVRVANRYFRAKRALKRSGAPPPPELRLVSTGEKRVEHREGVRRLYAALDEMTPHYRVALVLFAIDGRSLEQVADAMGIGLVAAKTRVWRARRLLRKAARADAVLAGYLVGSDI